MVNISDSSMIDINHYEVKKISVGENITNKPMASQVISMNGVDKYVMLDEFYLYVLIGNKEYSKILFRFINAAFLGTVPDLII